MNDFAAIDFETANRNPTSVCSVGVVVVRDGQIADTYYSLIKPEPEYYEYFNSRVHGLRQRDTKDARPFPEVWKEIQPRIEGLPLVAHNKQFDEMCLRRVMQCYRMDYPDYTFLCTYLAARKKLKGVSEHFSLDAVASYCGFEMQNHHHALADAEACARIALQLIDDDEAAYEEELRQKTLRNKERRHQRYERFKASQHKSQDQ